VTKFYMQL